MLQQKCSEFRIDYPYLQKDNLLISSKDLLGAFVSLRKKEWQREERQREAYNEREEK